MVKVKCISKHALKENEESIIFEVCVCSSMYGDCDDESLIYWKGKVCSQQFKLSPSKIIFPAWDCDERNNENIIKTNLEELDNVYQALIANSDVKWTVITNAAFTDFSLPYHKDLRFNVQQVSNKTTAQSRRKSTKQAGASSSEEGNIIHRNVRCNNCDESEKIILLNDFPYHTKHHVVTDEQLRMNKVDIQQQENDGVGSDRLILCYLCGKRSGSGCNLKCDRKTGTKNAHVISTDCIKGEIHGTFYNKLLNVTATNPWSNAPTLCPVCATVHWRWNMFQHYKYNHPTVTVPDAFIPLRIRS